MPLPFLAVAEPKYPQMVEFMKAAMRRVGANSIPELCERTGLNRARDQRDFYKWISGQHRPYITNVLPLMEKTGMLNHEEGVVAARGVASGDLAPESVAALTGLAKDVREGFRKLDRRMGRLEKRLPVEAPPSQTKKRRTG